MAYNNSFFLPLVFFSFFLPEVAQAQFFLNGSAVQLNDSCYQLTPAVNNRVGSIWNPDKINLNESFDVVMSLNL